MVAMCLEIGDLLLQLRRQNLVTVLQLALGHMVIVVKDAAQLDAVPQLIDPGADFIQLGLKLLPIPGHALWSPM